MLVVVAVVGSFVLLSLLLVLNGDCCSEGNKSDGKELSFGSL